MNGLAGVGPVPPARSHDPLAHAMAGEQKPRLRAACAPPPEQAGARDGLRERRGDRAPRRRADDPGPGIVAMVPPGDLAAPGSIIDIYV